jgi:DNA alkylation damage repair protein AlkB
MIPGVDEQDPYVGDEKRGHEPVNKTALRMAERLWKKPSSSNFFADFTPLKSVTAEFEYLGQTFGLRSEALTIPGKEGFMLFPGLLPPALQLVLATEIAYSYSKSENESNLHVFYRIPSEGLFAASDSTVNPCQGSTKCDIPASLLIDRLRWINLGRRYDWTSKEYDFDSETPPVPELLQRLSRVVVALVDGEPFKAEGGIINFYKPDDSLTCHVDRSEPNMARPLVSLSLGLSAVFLLGGRNREDIVQSIKVQSGDVIIMAGPSRSYFHGVPRVFASTFNYDSFHDHNNDGRLVQYLQTHRININLRQIF